MEVALKFVAFASLLAFLTSAQAFGQAVPSSRTLVGEVSKIDHGTREVHLLTEAGELEVDYAIVTRFAEENKGLIGRDSLEVGDAVRVIFLNEPDAVNSTVQFVKVLGKDDPAYRDFVSKKDTIDRSEVISVAITRIAPRNTPPPRDLARNSDPISKHRTTSERRRSEQQGTAARLPDTASVLPLLVSVAFGSAAVAGSLRIARKRR